MTTIKERRERFIVNVAFYKINLFSGYIGIKALKRTAMRKLHMQ
jgi:hypothetical protein